MNYLKFSENLKAALASNKLYQRDLAQYLGTTQQTVSKWINGETEPDLATIIEICLYLNETPTTLLGFDLIPEEVVNEYYKNVLNKKNH